MNGIICINYFYFPSFSYDYEPTDKKKFFAQNNVQRSIESYHSLCGA